MPSPFALICDIDETICVEFDQPVEAGCALLRKLAKHPLEVFYVTARPEETKASTERFFVEHHLPHARNLHLCPRWKSTLRHKKDTIQEIMRGNRVILSIGDGEDEERASKELAVPFLLIDPSNFSHSWRLVEKHLSAYLKGF